ncbi:hypothetical protein [Sphingomonas sp. ERG5]|uniref:hypothetical protein n=1 Tax=Sphingomonas sp. ERG5 TaxID=1381597 RepID=UPI00054BAFE7|nr:hypothetical protein [Sphingomonas sp. ERG5]
MAISISICNLALGELRAPPIADIDEHSVEARECARYYPQCLTSLLERHEWSFATKIATLAALIVNPRHGEWVYAYGLPADLATAKRLVPPEGAAVVGGRQPFIVEAGILFAQVPGAVLEYSTNNIAEAVMPAMFIDALAFALAARLAVPVRDSREAKGQLLQQAEIAAQRAIADDRNRQPQHDLAFVDEVTVVRGVGV